MNTTTKVMNMYLTISTIVFAIQVLPMIKISVYSMNYLILLIENKARDIVCM